MKLGPSVILIWHLESLPTPPRLTSEAWSVGTSGTSAQFWFGDNIQINPQPFLPRGKVAWVRTKTSWITPPTMVSVGLRRKVTYIIAQLYIFFRNNLMNMIICVEKTFLYIFSWPFLQNSKNFVSNLLRPVLPRYLSCECKGRWHILERESNSPTNHVCFLIVRLAWMRQMDELEVLRYHPPKWPWKWYQAHLNLFTRFQDINREYYDSPKMEGHHSQLPHDMLIFGRFSSRRAHAAATQSISRACAQWVTRSQSKVDKTLTSDLQKMDWPVILRGLPH